MLKLEYLRMIILGIETSCDDTGIAVLEVKGGKAPRFQILSNVVASQIKVHQKYGGVYPMLAKRAQNSSCKKSRRYRRNLRPWLVAMLVDWSQLRKRSREKVGCSAHTG